MWNVGRLPLFHPFESVLDYLYVIPLQDHSRHLFHFCFVLHFLLLFWFFIMLYLFLPWHCMCVRMTRVQTSTMIQIVHHHVIQPYASYPTASVRRMVRLFQAIYPAKMYQWWLRSHLMMPSTTTTSTCTKKSSTANAKIQMAAKSKPRISYHTNIPTIRPCKKLIVKVTKLQFTRLRK